MKKIIFIDFKLLKNISNIELKFNRPNNEKKIRDVPKNQTYFTILNYNNKYYLFYKDKPDKNHKIYNHVDFFGGDLTYYERSKIPINFGNKKLIIEDPVISHNIVPFHDRKDEIKLVGGLHWSKYTYDKKVINKRDIFIDYNKSKIANPKVKLNDIKCNGIYLFNFHDGKIKFVQDLPIINGTHKGLVNKREGQVISEFDGRSIIVYFKNKYFIYLRSNLRVADGSVGFSDNKKKTSIKGGGVRGVQYATSDDCRNWSEFKFININFDYKRDNIYFFGVQRYTDDILVSTFPYSNGKEGFIGISFSYDGINWTKITKLIDSKMSKTNIDRIIDFSIHQIINYNKKMLFYIHRNYIWWEAKDHKNYISCMELEEDRLTNIYSEDGEFSIQLSNINNLALNYKIEKHGYIKAMIYEKNNYKYNYFDNLEKKDSLYTELKWNNNSFKEKEKVTIYFRVKKSNIYAIYY